jgi:hypothetical protein
MNRFIYSARGRASAAAAIVAAAGLLLAACGGGSSGGSSTGGSSGGSASSSSSSSSSSSTSSSSNNSGGGSTSVVSSNSVPFPIAAGNTWVYRSATVAGITSTVTDKVISITPVSGGNLVTMSNHISIGGATTHISYIFHNDGSITYPFTQLGKTAVIVKGSLEWPSAAVINSGQPTNSTIEMALKAGGTAAQRVTAHVTVKGAGTATVTVPAGTYTATIVQMTEKYTVEGFTGSIEVQTWVANGVGPVRSEATITEGGHTVVVSDQKLVSFTKG